MLNPHFYFIDFRKNPNSPQKAPVTRMITVKRAKIGKKLNPINREVVSHASAAKSEQIGKIVGTVVARIGAMTPPTVTVIVTIPVRMPIDVAERVRKKTKTKIRNTGMTAGHAREIEVWKTRREWRVGTIANVIEMMKSRREVEMTKAHLEAEMTKAHLEVEMMKTHLEVEMMRNRRAVEMMKNRRDEIETEKQKAPPIGMRQIGNVANNETTAKRGVNCWARRFL